MSDLNQLIGYAKAGQKVPKVLIEYLIENADTATFGPICCFFTGSATGPARYSLNRRDGYPTFNGDVNLDDKVVGCSRGYMPYSKWLADPKSFLDAHCKGCAAEARKVLRKSRNGKETK